MRTYPHHRPVRHHAAAFTLIELLVVISLITVLMTVGSFGLKNYSKASGVGAAVPIAQGIFAQARSLAIEKGTDTRVLVHDDNGTDNLNRERRLRYLVVQYWDTKGTEVTTDDEWVTASRGVKLPDGVFYSLDLSQLGNAPNLVGGLNMPPPHEPTQSVRQVEARLPGQPSGQTSNCYQYRFNSQGIIVDPYPDSGTSYGNNVPRFVMRAGGMPPGAAKPKANAGAGTKNAAGFVIWRNGRTSVFRHPDQIAADAVFNDATKF